MSTKIIDISNTETPLSELVSLALQGEEVIITENDKPLVRIVPVSQSQRVAGLNRGEIWTSEDFDHALPDSFWTGNL